MLIDNTFRDSGKKLNLGAGGLRVQFSDEGGPTMVGSDTEETF